MTTSKTFEELAGTATQLEFPPEVLGLAAEISASNLRAELDLIPDTEFAKAIGVETQSLSAWRSEGYGPDYVKLGRTVFYRRQDLKVWINKCRVEPENTSRKRAA